jgi:alkylation response protein AidB-like acyl-CoA dehydrogenase
MNFELSDDQRALQRRARDFATREFAPHAARWDAERIFPRDAIARAGRAGFCGVYIDARHGGQAASRLDATMVFEALAAACTSTTAYLTIHNMATWMVTRWARGDVAARWARKLTCGEALASYCLTEPGAGSDAASLAMTAARDGHDFVLRGTKAFVSGAGATDVLVVIARTGSDEISAFAVPSSTPGIRFGREADKLGWHSQPTRTLVFHDVRVPADHLLGELGEGFRIAMKGLDGERLNLATCSIGAAQAALDAARGYLRQRAQFGRPLASFQALQFKIADMTTELVTARQLVRFAATQLDAGAADAPVYCAMAKRLATDAGFHVCNEALQIHGGVGYLRDYPLERYLRDTRVHQILGGTNEIMRVIVARRVLDLAHHEAHDGL